MKGGLPFRRILVANRGEIALRIVRTCRAWDVETVAVYSAPDRDAPHVLLADRACLLEGGDPRAAYLNVDSVVQAATQSGAEAVHPGYGFLSENDALASALAAEGIAFVGPPAGVLGASADKLAVKRRVAKAGVPVVPGSLDLLPEGHAAATRRARDVGFPLLLKAAGGGGGKGLRLVEGEADLGAALEGARREAAAAFDRPALYVERLLQGARHVEVQVLADLGGRVVTVGDRDCSLQRRHQKVIEECPAPDLAEPLRRALHEAASAAARAVNYQNAGTVEFLVLPEGAFYFLELNRRLQVEHPVTELCFDLDLVEWQIRLAGGEPLPRRFESLTPRGHAIEARVYAEDPQNDFLPSSGEILLCRLPEGPGIRVDAAVRDGSVVSPHFDPLLAKVVAFGATREGARRRLDRALSETALIGVRHNVAFLRALLQHPEWVRGAIATDWLEAHRENLARPLPADDLVLLAAAAAEPLSGATSRAAPAGSSPEGATPWRVLGDFRLAGLA